MDEVKEKPSMDKIKEKYPLSIRVIIYSYLTLTDMMKTISRLSKTEREQLLKLEVPGQKKILKIDTQNRDYIDFGNLEYFSKLSDELRYWYNNFGDKESMLLQYSFIHFKDKLQNSNQNFIISQNSLFKAEFMKTYIAQCITQLSLQFNDPKKLSDENFIEFVKRFEDLRSLNIYWIDYNQANFMTQT